VINAVHALIYADDPDAARAFFRDVMEFPFTDRGGGFLIFGSGPTGVLTVHPRGWEHEGDERSPSPHTEAALTCDDIGETIAQLTAKGVEFSGDVSDEGWGLAVVMRVPGIGEMMLYQPKYDPPAAVVPDPDVDETSRP
jgi:catechol 2,3-dioxygenase-like lactoylglutathione lyase family enzyme